MSRILKSIVLFALPGLFAASSCSAMGQPKITDCFQTSNANAAQVCRNIVVATYQAIQVAQAEHGMTLKTCQFGTDIGEDKLIDSIRPYVLDMPDSVMDMPIVALTIATLEASSTCHLGLATRVGGLTAGNFLRNCMQESKQRSMPLACFAYAGGMSESLNGLSGSDGTDELFCTPNGKIDLKLAVHLFTDTIRRDPGTTQTRPAASVMVDALARKYPCK